MAAMGVDREDLGSGAHQQDLLITDMSEQGLAGEVAGRDALGKIRSGGWGLFVCHIESFRRRPLR
jgi:hypothetical protein